MDIGASTSVYVQVIQTVPGFLTHRNSLEGQALKELKLKYTDRKKMGEEIFIIPKESVRDLKQLNLLLVSLAWCGGDKMRQESWHVLLVSLSGHLRVNLTIQRGDCCQYTGGDRKKTVSY